MIPGWVKGLVKWVGGSSSGNAQSAQIVGHNNQLTQVSVYVVAGSDVQVDPSQFVLTQGIGALPGAPKDANHAERQKEPSDLHNHLDRCRDLTNKGKAQTALDQLGGFGEVPPYARYRVLALSAWAQHKLGDNGAASKLWNDALALRPNDPDAKASAAFGQLLLGKDTDAAKGASEVLRENPIQEIAATTLILSNIKNASCHHPDQLVDPDCLRKPDVRTAIVAFWRDRQDPRWQDLAAQAADEFPDHESLAVYAADAKLSDILDYAGFFAGERVEPGLFDTVGQAADTYRRIAIAQLENESPDEKFVAPIVHNASLALRVAGRASDAIALVSKGIETFPEASYLRLQLTLLLIDLGKHEEALKASEYPTTDIQLICLRCQLIVSLRSAQEALVLAKNELDPSKPGYENLATFVAEVSLLEGDEDEFARAMDFLKSSDRSQAVMKLLQVEAETAFSTIDGAKKGNIADQDDEYLLPDADISAVLREAISDSRSFPFPEALQLAQHCETKGLFHDASDILHERTDLTRNTAGLRTYIRCTIGAGLFARAKAIFSGLSTQLLELPFYQRSRAVHFFNSGDVVQSIPWFQTIIRKFPNSLPDQLHLVDALLRTNDHERARRSLTEFITSQPIQGTIREKTHLSQLLMHFGMAERAQQIAYEAWLEHNDQPEAWIALMSSVINNPVADGSDANKERIEVNDFFEVKLDDGQIKSYVIEPDEDLRYKSKELCIPLDHRISKAALGLRVGDTFDWPIGDGGLAEVTAIKTKFVSAFQKASHQYEEIFPDRSDFRSVRIEKDDKFAGVRKIADARAKFVEEWTKAYAEGTVPFFVMSTVIGIDEIGAFEGMEEVNLTYRVCVGNFPERDAAHKSIVDNARKGVVVDAISLHVIFRTELQTIIEAVCGPIHVTQSTIDLLGRRKAQAVERKRRGHGNIYSDGGNLRYVEVPDDVLERAVQTAEKELTFAKSFKVLPTVPKDDPPKLVGGLAKLTTSALASVYAASGGDLLFMSEDLTKRQIATLMNVPSTWLQPILTIAKERRLLSVEDYANCIAKLVEFRQRPISIDGYTLFRAAEFSSSRQGDTTFDRCVTALGGSDADPISHRNVACQVIHDVWLKNRPDRRRYCSLILENLVRGRTEDYGEILDGVSNYLSGSGLPRAVEFLNEWKKGHFLA
jgi:tetratricopeptide (TPR) repeat protein